MLRRLFPDASVGITTFAVPEKLVILRENSTGEEYNIGLFDPSTCGTEMKMKPLYTNIEEAGVKVLKKCAETKDEWCVLDELGYLELKAERYISALKELGEKKRLAAVIRRECLQQYTELFGKGSFFLVDTDEPFGKQGCVIMASGMGRRFGGNKLMAEFRGKRMIERCLETTDNVFVERVVVTRHKEIYELCQSRNIKCILHTLPYRSDTVRLGIEAMAGLDSCMFCPADQPLLTSDTVKALALSALNEKEYIQRTSFDDTVGTPTVFPKWTFGELSELPEGMGGSYVINKHKNKVKNVSAQNPYELMDVDTPDDLIILAEKNENA